MSDHDRYLERVRHAERVCAESDLYWRTNRWAIDGRGVSPDRLYDVSDSFEQIARMADTVIFTTRPRGVR